VRVYKYHTALDGRPTAKLGAYSIPKISVLAIGGERFACMPTFTNIGIIGDIYEMS
jgi:hypothetical protein